MRSGPVMIVACALLALGGSDALAQAAVGTNAEVVGAVRTHGAAEPAWRPAAVGGTVRLRDEIATGAASRLVVAMRDRATLTVGANAALTVDEFVAGSGADPLEAVFAMVRGAFRYVSGDRQDERVRVGFRTPTAVIGIRGTIIEVAVGREAVEVLADETVELDLSADAENAAVIVLVEGEIDIDLDGDRVTVRDPGQAVAVAGRRLSRPFALSRRLEERLGQRLPPRQPRPGAEALTRPPGQGPGGADGPGGRTGPGATPQPRTAPPTINRPQMGGTRPRG